MGKHGKLFPLQTLFLTFKVPTDKNTSLLGVKESQYVLMSHIKYNVFVAR